jgi:hypothetical protein
VWSSCAPRGEIFILAGAAQPLLHGQQWQLERDAHHPPTAAFSRPSQARPSTSVRGLTSQGLHQTLLEPRADGLLRQPPRRSLAPDRKQRRQERQRGIERRHARSHRCGLPVCERRRQQHRRVCHGEQLDARRCACSEWHGRSTGQKESAARPTDAARCPRHLLPTIGPNARMRRVLPSSCACPVR